MINDIVYELLASLKDTLLDIFPIFFVIIFFQGVVIRKKIPNTKKTLLGFTLVIVGLTFLLLGLDKALFPIGEYMAKQLTSENFLNVTHQNQLSHWHTYIWVYIFALSIGFSSAMAEPTLKAVASRIEELSGGNLKKGTIRFVVAIGSGMALFIGCLRIVLDIPLVFLLLGLVIIIAFLSFLADKNTIAMAYDIGVVTTSTITVPIVTALGIGLAGVIPYRNPAIDGFGLVLLICLMPIITILSYSVLTSSKK